MTKKERDLRDLRRSSVIWIATMVWIGAGYAFQDPAHDAYDLAQRAIFSWAMLVVIPLITAVLVWSWSGAVRRRG